MRGGPVRCRPRRSRIGCGRRCTTSIRRVAGGLRADVGALAVHVGCGPGRGRDYVEVMAGFHDGGVRQMLHAIAEADLRPVLPTIEVPTFCSTAPRTRALHGRSRRRCTTRSAAGVGGPPGRRTHEQPGGSDLFNAVARGFLDRNTDSTGRTMTVIFQTSMSLGGFMTASARRRGTARQGWVSDCTSGVSVPI